MADEHDVSETQGKRIERPWLKEYQFKVGNNANPIGSNAHNPALKALRRLTVEAYAEVVEAVLGGNLGELKRMAKDDPDSPALQVGIARAFLKAINTGDYTVIERIAERIVGKIPEQLVVASRNLNVNANTTVDPAVVKKAYDDLERDT